jgi:hypothetical protein
MEFFVKNEKYSMPKDYKWEYHNALAFEEARIAEESGKKGALEEYFAKYRESVEQREERFEKQIIERELSVQKIKDFQQFKEDPKTFMKKALALGKSVDKFWSRPPAPITGGGVRMKQNLDGSWSQEYKPRKSMGIHQWLDANKHIPNQPTEEQLAIDAEAKREKMRKWWDMMYDVTNNFSRGDSVPRTIPGQGQGQTPVKYTDYNGWKE